MKNLGIIVDNDLNYDIRVIKEIEILKKKGIKYFCALLCF